MRDISSSLLKTQQSPSNIPYVKLQASNVINGLIRLDWERLYSGTEEDYYHAATMPGDGSLVRARITPVADGRKLYRQRVPSPDPSSDFSSWTYTNQYNCLVVATASLGSEVSIFWINTSRQLRRIKSIDSGITWNSPETIDYSPSTAVNGLAAAYKPNGDLVVFFADQSVLYAKRYAGGSWQTKTAWDKTTGDLSGVTVVYDGDWCLLVTGASVIGDYKTWWLVYGDGNQLPAGNWSGLNEMASAPAGGDFTYSSPFLDKPDVFRCFFIEQYNGNESYNRPFWSHSIPGTGFVNSFWREVIPFNLSSEYGLAMVHHGTYCWLSAPYGVWRDSLEIYTLDLTSDVLYLENKTDGRKGTLSIELRNDDGRYSSLPSLLGIGNQLDMSPGYLTSNGKEVSNGQTFILQTYEHTSSRGKASLRLVAQDGWAAISLWTARHQFRWNKQNNEKSVKDILAFVVGRAGLKLEIKSASDVISGFFPDFTIHPGDNGASIINRLLSFVPDYIFIEGSTAYIVNPQTSQRSSYGYGILHPVLEGYYRTGMAGVNRIQVEGHDPVSGQPIIAESLDWTEIIAFHDRLVSVQDRNLDTLDRVRERGDTLLRKAGIAAMGGEMTVPVNCGQQLYDVIDVTDTRAGLHAAKKRIMGLTMLFEPRGGRYEHRLVLGGV